MKVAWVLTVAGIVFVTAMATSTTALTAPRTNRVSIAYVVPKNPAHQPIYDVLKERRALEKLQVLLSPFRLPRRLKLSLAGCDGEADAFYGDDAITICYEYIADLWKNRPAQTTPDGVTPIDAVLGPFVDTSLHEFGHALIDMLDLPVLGREEDAADLLASYIYLHFGKDEARRLILGTAYAYMSEAKSAGPLTLEKFANEHGTPAQRAYNVLCIAYGAEPKVFADVAKKHLPKERAEQCEDEYQQVAHAFETLVGPHVDRALARKVLNRTWLREPTKRPPRRSAPGKASAQ